MEDTQLHNLVMINDEDKDVFGNVSKITFKLRNGKDICIGMDDTLTRKQQIDIVANDVFAVELTQLYTPNIKTKE